MWVVLAEPDEETLRHGNWRNGLRIREAPDRMVRFKKESRAHYARDSSGQLRRILDFKNRAVWNDLTGSNYDLSSDGFNQRGTCVEAGRHSMEAHTTAI